MRHSIAHIQMSRLSRYGKVTTYPANSVNTSKEYFSPNMECWCWCWCVTAVIVDALHWMCRDIKKRGGAKKRKSENSEQTDSSLTSIFTAFYMALQVTSRLLNFPFKLAWKTRFHMTINKHSYLNAWSQLNPHTFCEIRLLSAS